MLDTLAPETAAPWRPLFPFSSHWLEVANEQLHYIDEGPAADEVPWSRQERDGAQVAAAPLGPEQHLPLLFVHGNPTWSFHWRELVRHFRAKYRCLALDHLGCGLSAKPSASYCLQERCDHLLNFIERLDLTRITLVAQDWGGAIGLAAAIEQPARFARIVLMNTGAFPPPHFPWRIRVCRTPWIGRLAVQGANLFCRAALRMTLARTRRLPHDVSLGYLAPYADWTSRRAIYDFIADIPANPKHPTWQTLADIDARLSTLDQMPSLLVWGMRDWCFTPACLRRFTEVWPRAQVRELADGGHWVVEDASAETIATMSAFLHETDGAALAGRKPDTRQEAVAAREQSECTSSASKLQR